MPRRRAGPCPETPRQRRMRGNGLGKTHQEQTMPSPLSSPRQLGRALAFLSLFLLCPAPSVHAQAPRSTPGLVLATDGRTATCDVLAFTPDGSRLLAVGDDKVVRRWIMTD